MRWLRGKRKGGEWQEGDSPFRRHLFGIPTEEAVVVQGFFYELLLRQSRSVFVQLTCYRGNGDQRRQGASSSGHYLYSKWLREETRVLEHKIEHVTLSMSNGAVRSNRALRKTRTLDTRLNRNKAYRYREDDCRNVQSSFTKQTRKLWWWDLSALAGASINRVVHRCSFHEVPSLNETQFLSLGREVEPWSRYY